MRRSVASTVLVLGFTAVAWGADAPVTVSPGNASKLALIGDACPTFNWGAVPGAKSYELVVYRLSEEHEEARPVLSQRIAGSALGWTPALAQCLKRGGQYAWSVRAVGRKQVPNWSAPRLFQVVLGPSEVEFEEALQIVRQYLATHGAAEAEGVPGAPIELEPQAEREASELSPAPAVVGTTQLSVDGGVVATSFTGDGSTLTSLPAASNVVCTGCVGSTDIAANAIRSIEIANGTIESGDIGFRAIVGFQDIALNSITSTEIQASGVRGIHIQQLRRVLVECDGECTDSTLSQICGFGFEPLAVDCADMDDDLTGAANCGGDNLCKISDLKQTGTDSLGTFCDDVGGPDVTVYCISTN